MYGGTVFLLTFKGEDGKSYRSWIDPKNRNFRHWKSIVEDVPVGTLLDGLVVKNKNLIDADSRPVVESSFSAGSPQEEWVIFQHPLINRGIPCRVLRQDLPEWRELALKKAAINQSA